ncbi:MAG: protein kinase [Myxococcales bacterium]|nr:protein kinase [Myxococcales bacterium]
MKKPIPFGKYTLLERINVGGMAEVFRAKAFGVEGFERLVAVKRILPAIAEDKEFIRMFIDEAKLAVQLNHANIAQIFDLGVVDNSHYIALEHVHGRDLRAIFDRNRADREQMSVAEACFILMKVCEGLDYAHNKRDQSGRELGLVHRDVSPQNVLVSFEGEIKLVEFGIAKAVGQQSSKTQAGILKGKFGYMSPEQVRGLSVDRRSDVFSCGIVLYELLTNERLFVGETDFATLEKVRNVEILPPTTYNPKIPEQLERIILKALTLRPEDRYQNAIDLHDELQAFVYTSGEFYSRKDLASWMKRTFSKEIAEESARLEEYRQIRSPDDVPSARAPRQSSSPPPLPPRAQTSSTKPPPPPASRRMTTPSVLYDGGKTSIDRPNPGMPDRLDDTNRDAELLAQGALAAAEPARKPRGAGLAWDDEELETQIYDTPDAQMPARRSGRASERPSTRAGTASSPPPRASRTSGSHATSDLPILSSASPDAQPTLMALADASPTPSELPTARARETRPPRPSASSLPLPGVGAHVDLSASSHAARTSGRISAAIPIGTAVAPAAQASKSGSERWQWYALAVAVSLSVVVLLLWFNRARPQLAAETSGFDLYVTPATGVKWKLDGVEQSPVEQGAQVRKLSVGTHQLSIEAPAGYMHHSQEVQIAAGAIARVDVVLRPVAVEVAFESTPPGATVELIVDGVKTTLGQTPVKKALDPQKQVEVVYSLEGYASATMPLAFGSEPTQTARAQLQKTIAAPPVVAIRPEVVRPVPQPVVPTRPPPAVTPPAVTPPVTRPAVTPPTTRPPVVTPPTPAADGILKLSSKPPCDIYINGKNTGLRTPQPELKLPPGTHRITLISNEFEIKDVFSVTIVSGKTDRVVKDYSAKLTP